MLLVQGKTCSPDQLADLVRIIAEDPADYVYTHYLPILHHCGVSAGFADRHKGIVTGVYRKSLVSFSLLAREVACIVETLSTSPGLEPILLEGVAVAESHYPAPPVRWSNCNAILVPRLPARFPRLLFDRLPGYVLMYDNFECCALRSPNGLVHLLWRCLPDGLLHEAVSQSPDKRNGSVAITGHGLPGAIPELQLLLALRRVGAADSQLSLELALLDACYMLTGQQCYRPLQIESSMRCLQNRFSISRGLEILAAHVALEEVERDLLEVISGSLPDNSYPPRGEGFYARLNDALWLRPRRLASHPQFSYSQYFSDLWRRQIGQLFS